MVLTCRTPLTDVRETARDHRFWLARLNAANWNTDLIGCAAFPFQLWTHAWVSAEHRNEWTRSPPWWQPHGFSWCGNLYLFMPLSAPLALLSPLFPFLTCVPHLCPCVIPELLLFLLLLPRVNLHLELRLPKRLMFESSRQSYTLSLKSVRNVMLFHFSTASALHVSIQMALASTQRVLPTHAAQLQARFFLCFFCTMLITM